MSQHCDLMIDVGRRKFLTGAGVAAAASPPRVCSVRRSGARRGPRQLSRPTGSPTSATSRSTSPWRSPIRTPTRRACSQARQDGAGRRRPDGDIVGFSTICPHKGFPLNYNAADKTFNCPGHYSRFDCEPGGQQIWGQATQNLPQYTLRVDDNGDIYAEGVDELLYGRLSNVL